MIIAQFEKDTESRKPTGKLSRIFDSLRMALPEMLLEELQGQDSTEKADINHLAENIEDIKKEINDSQIAQKGKERDIEYKQLEIKRLQTEYNTVKDEEDSLKLRVCNELNLNLHNETYRQSWLDNRHYDLGKLIQEKNLKLDQLKQDLWKTI